MSLPTDKQARKERPMARGLLDYFPDACAEVAHVSFVGNQQHNPGEEMRWTREKSKDHADCVARHLTERGTIDDDGLRHSAKLAWRALALLQLELEDAAGPIVQKLPPHIVRDQARSTFDQLKAMDALDAGILKTTSFPSRGIVYISGPMRNIPDLNFPAFDAARDRFKAWGYEVISPADMDRADNHTPRPNSDYVRRDVEALLKCTHIAMIPGWNNSRGARAEIMIAKWLGLKVLDAVLGDVLPEWRVDV